MSSLSANAAALLSVLVHDQAERPAPSSKALDHLTSVLVAQAALHAHQPAQPAAQPETIPISTLIDPMRELFTQFSTEMHRCHNQDRHMEHIAQGIQAQLTSMNKLLEAHNEKQRLQQQNFHLQMQLHQQQQQAYSSRRLSRSYSGRRQKSCSRSPVHVRPVAHVIEPAEPSHTAALPVKRPRRLQPEGPTQSISKKRRMLLDDDPPETNKAG